MEKSMLQEEMWGEVTKAGIRGRQCFCKKSNERRM
jgi:hypothetical protein